MLAISSSLEVRPGVLQELAVKVAQSEVKVEVAAAVEVLVEVVAWEAITHLQSWQTARFIMSHAVVKRMTSQPVLSSINLPSIALHRKAKILVPRLRSVAEKSSFAPARICTAYLRRNSSVTP